VEVGSENVHECAELVARGRAHVAGPLVGDETTVADLAASEPLQRLLKEEHVEPAQFSIPAAPELGSRGAWRPALLPLPPLGLRTEETSVWFRFSLPRGSYATVLLREFLKRGASG
jgi:tRNA pseudouridine13 synthase